MLKEALARVRRAEDNLEQEISPISPVERIKAFIGRPVIRTFRVDGIEWGIEATTGVASQEGAGRTANENIMKAYKLYREDTRRERPQ